MKVLIIDNNDDIAKDISFCLQVRYPDANITSVANGENGVRLVKSESPELVLVNSSLPDISTLDVINKIREFSDVAMLVITDEENPLERAKELEAGADEYVAKPFTPIELLAKVRALLRRVEGSGFQQEGAVKIGDELSVNFGKREVYLAGQRIKLTPIEFDLLSTLIKNEGRVLTHSFLLGKVWGIEDNSDMSYIKKYISRLRSKLRFNGTMSKIIFTERGVGYRFVRPG